MLVAPESSPGGTLGSKNIRTSEAAPVKRGDRQPEQQTLVVPQRQCLRLVVYLPVQWPLPPARGTTACPCIVAHITKTDTCSRCGRILVFYSPYCLELEFCELRLDGVLRSSSSACSPKFATCEAGLYAKDSRANRRRRSRSR